MDAEQLFETTMNPEKRVLVQVKVDDAAETVRNRNQETATTRR